MQRAKLAVLVPPAVGQFRKLGQFGGIGVDAIDVVHAGIIQARSRLQDANKKDPPKRVFSRKQASLLGAGSDYFDLYAAVFGAAFCSFVVGNRAGLALAFGVDTVLFNTFGHQVGLNGF